LSALVREASEFALKEFIKNPVPENEIVKLKHFEMAFLKIKPSVSVKVNVYIFVLLCNIVETKNLLLFKGL
jgi:SpoVK/Ycf46/Vps4 family AAA+-type ATPase